jgi:FixJ family two-component response regulator
MSGRIDESVQSQLREAGVTGFVEKPFGYEQIQQAISVSLQ